MKIRRQNPRFATLALVIASVWSEASAQANAETCLQQLVPTDFGNTVMFTPDRGNTLIYVDTGTSHSLVSDSLIERDNEPLGVVQAETLSEPLQLQKHGAQDLSSGCSKYRTNPYTIKSGIDIDPLLQTFSSTPSIAMGRDALSQFDVIIDSINDQIKLTPHKPNHNTKVRFRWPFMVEVSFQNTTHACLLDTGFSQRTSIYVPAGSNLYEIIAATPGLQWPSYHPVSATKGVTDVFVSDAEITGLEGKGIIFSLERVEATNPENESENKFCFIGNAFLPDTTISLSPDRQFATLKGVLARPEYNRWGLHRLDYSYDTKAFTVTHLGELFDAYLSGMRVGDLIRSFDGQDLTIENVFEMREKSYSGPGVTTRLQIVRDDEELTLTITNSDHFADE